MKTQSVKMWGSSKMHIRDLFWYWEPTNYRYNENLIWFGSSQIYIMDIWFDYKSSQICIMGFSFDLGSSQMHNWGLFWSWKFTWYWFVLDLIAHEFAKWAYFGLVSSQMHDGVYFDFESLQMHIMGVYFDFESSQVHVMEVYFDLGNS